MTTKPAAKPAAKPDPLAYIRANYGYLAGFLDIPEIRKVLLTAAKQKYDVGKLQGAIYKTAWWKKTAEVTRQWVALSSTDPATAKQRLAQTKTDIASMAKQAGVALTPAQIDSFALNVNKFGWSPQQVQSAIGHQYHYDAQSAASGKAATTLLQLKSIANDYLVPVSDATLQSWTQNVLAGDIDANTFAGWAQQQAKSMWPGLADAIDRGVTVADYTNPYRETIARALEKSPDEINLADTRWRSVIDQIDPKTGQHTAMSLSDAEQFARKQPEWKQTQAAKDQASSMVLNLGKLFGEVA